MSNLNLWDSVKETDPKHTKGFSKGGGFKGTSINPTYNNRRATEAFGTCGIGWGVDIVRESYQEGAPIFINGAQACKEVIHILQIKLWYILDGKRGEIPSFGQTTFVGQNKNGIFTDEEAPKKSLTDATTKALSMLGFGADIFLGLYDDVKYINDIKEAHSSPKAAKTPKVPTETASQIYDRIITYLDLNQDISKESFMNWWNAEDSKADRAMLKTLSPSDYNELIKMRDEILEKFK